MLQLGDYNELEVARQVSIGLYLTSEDGDILLPGKYVPEGTEVGDKLTVFVYRDSEDRMIATTQEPLVTVGHFAVLQVKDVTDFGAFLDWGLEKDLFVPFRQQRVKMRVGQKYPVYLYLDETTDRIVATSKIGQYLQEDTGRLHVGQQLPLLVTEETDLGFRVIVDERYLGLLYHNEIFQTVEVGDRLQGIIKNIRPDGKLDMSLQQAGMDEVATAKKRILEALKENNYTLNLSDDSSPDEIKAQLSMSKKLFKKAIGGLYREGVINLQPGRIVLNQVSD